jgi:uncharacterized protein
LILPDVNVLLYVMRTDLPQHGHYKPWLEEIVNGAEPYGMSPQVLASVIRIATRSGVFARRSSLQEALDFTAVLLTQPNCHLIEPGPRHWDTFTDLCRTANATGNLVQDAWFAALAIESGCEWITNDRDYARFPGLRWRAPF